MERGGGVEQADELAAAVRSPTAAVHVGVLPEDRHRPPVEAGQAGDDRTPPAAADLEEAALIADRFDDRAHLVDTPWLAGHDRDQLVVTPLRAVAAQHPLGQLVHVGGQVRKEPACALERLFFAVDHIVYGAVGRVDVRVAEFLFAVIAERGLLDQRRPGDHHLRSVAHDDRVVRGGHPGGADARHRAQRQRHRRCHREVVDDDVPAPQFGDVGAARHLDGLHRAAAAHAVHQSDVGQPHLIRHGLSGVAFLGDGGVRGAAAHREVVAGQDNRPIVDAGQAEDEVGWRQVDEIAVIVVFRDAGGLADLVERALVGHGVDALAHGHLAEKVLPLDLVGSAECLGERFAAAQLGDLRLPAHATPVPAARF